MYPSRWLAPQLHVLSFARGLFGMNQQIRKVVVMGPSGAGKSTIGRRLAQLGDATFLDGDVLHSPQNIAKMSRGQSLSDQDRLPWLEAIAAWLVDGHGRRVVACSALKLSYRDILRTQVEDLARDSVRFVYLAVSRSELERRLATREGHFAGPQLLESQLATLEPPLSDSFDGELSPDELVEQICKALDWARRIE